MQMSFDFCFIDLNQFLKYLIKFYILTDTEINIYPKLFTSSQFCGLLLFLQIGFWCFIDSGIVLVFYIS